MWSHKSRVLIATLLAALTITGGAMAEEADSANENTALKERLALLDQERKVLEAERLLLEEQKKLGAARAGPSAVAEETLRLKERTERLKEEKSYISESSPSLPKGLEGSISVDQNQSIEASVAAYKTLNEVSLLIVDEIKEFLTEDRAVLLLNDTDTTALSGWSVFIADLTLLTDQLKQHATAQEISGAALFSGVGTVTKAAADIMALFRTDTEFKARSVTISDEALIAEVGKALGKRKKFYPSVFPAWSAKATEVAVHVSALRQVRDEAKARHLDRLKTIETLAATAATEEDKAAVNAARIRLESKWAELDSSYTAISNSLAKRDPATGLTPLAQLARGLWLSEQLSGSDGATTPRGLVLRVLHSGGTYVLKKTFWSGTTMRQSGGVIAQYFLIDGDGEILSSGAVGKVREFGDLTVQ